jgi:hypothetical protein
MPRRENSIYEGERIPRTRESEYLIWRDPPHVKKHPKYVHGKIGMSSLLHKIDYVEMRWYDYDWDYFLRLKNPILTARTVCGMLWRLEVGKGTTCEIPNPDTVLCAACHGEGRNFGRNGKTKITKRQAKDRGGCIAHGEQI